MYSSYFLWFQLFAYFIYIVLKTIKMHFTSALLVLYLNNMHLVNTI